MGNADDLRRFLSHAACVPARRDRAETTARRDLAALFAGNRNSRTRDDADACPPRPDGLERHDRGVAARIRRHRGPDDMGWATPARLDLAPRSLRDPMA